MTSEEFRTDPMFLRNQCAGTGDFEMPMIRREEVALENVQLVGYDNLSKKETNKMVHFFLDDYKFEAVWNKPDSKVEVLKEYRAVLSPQFSVYTEMPLPLQIYNIFRSRWCGAYLQKHGVSVIPTVSWGKPTTFWFCFDGIEKGSVVAVSTLGVRTEKTLFLQGYSEMLKRIRPEAVICYGKPFEEMKGRIIEIDYAKTNGFFSEKGMGSVFGKNLMPKNDSQIKHLFRKKEGHLQDTPENRALLLRVANDPKNYIGTDANGVRWYAELLADGRQVWVSVRNGIIQNGGINSQLHPWDPITGLNHPKKTGGEFDAYLI